MTYTCHCLIRALAETIFLRHHILCHEDVREMTHYRKQSGKASTVNSEQIPVCTMYLNILNESYDGLLNHLFVRCLTSSTLNLLECWPKYPDIALIRSIPIAKHPQHSFS